VLLLRVVQLAADAENEDNISEQKRQNGKRVRYGEVVQVISRISALITNFSCLKLF